MNCLNPFFTRPPYILGDGREYMLPYPCGKCEVCRKNNASVWTFRLTQERLNWKDVAFVTLTYSPEYCPKDYSLVPSHLSSFIKRLRYYIFDKYPIKYYGVGEYGSKKGRPHYHLIIFGLPPEDYHLITKAWTYGYNKTEPSLSDNSLAYVAQYVQKKIGSKSQVSKYYNNREVPFMRCSKGIGLAFVLSMPFYTPVVRVNGYLKYIGRYLCNKLSEKFGLSERNRIASFNYSYEFITQLVREYCPVGFNKERIAYALWIEGFKNEFLRRLQLQDINKPRKDFT